jgi:hypothetical protein
MNKSMICLIISVFLGAMIGYFTEQAMVVGCAHVLQIDEKRIPLSWMWSLPPHDTIVEYTEPLQRCPFTTRQCTRFMKGILNPLWFMNNKEL